MTCHHFSARQFRNTETIQSDATQYLRRSFCLQDLSGFFDCFMSGIGSPLVPLHENINEATS